MYQKLIFFLIILLTFIIRFWRIDSIPPIIQATYIERVISPILSLGSVILMYLFTYSLYKEKKLSLLSAWIMSIFPWSIEQGRIISQVNKALFFILLTLVLVKKVRSKLSKLFLYLLIPLEIYVIYPQFWLFRQNNSILSISNIVNNLFIFISPDLLFFKNITFWWGGVRGFGIMYLAFLPFFILGIYEFLYHPIKLLVIWFILILIVSSLSPFFPESREFFLVLPVLTLIIALGILKLSKLFRQHNWVARMVIILLLLFVIYDMAQFFHLYMVHYSQQVQSNINYIHDQL